MTKEREALKLALEWFEGVDEDPAYGVQGHQVIAAIKEALAQPEQEPVAWKLVPIKPTDEMLKAMDECSTEGYDERLYAGHAASVYMAAVDAAPTPPQLKEPEQEPVAYMSHNKENFVSADDVGNSVPNWTDYYPTPLYTTPPPCPTCEALARTVMMDQTGRDA